MMYGTLTYNGGQIYYEVAGSGESVIFTHGFTLDYTTRQSQVDFLVKRVKNRYEYKSLPDTSHWLPEESPSLFAKLVMKFIDNAGSK